MMRAPQIMNGCIDTLGSGFPHFARTSSVSRLSSVGQKILAAYVASQIMDTYYQVCASSNKKDWGGNWVNFQIFRTAVNVILLAGTFFNLHGAFFLYWGTSLIACASLIPSLSQSSLEGQLLLIGCLVKCVMMMTHMFYPKSVLLVIHLAATIVVSSLETKHFIEHMNGHENCKVAIKNQAIGNRINDWQKFIAPLAGDVIFSGVEMKILLNSSLLLRK